MTIADRGIVADRTARGGAADMRPADIAVVRGWLALLAAMVFVMVLVGGATRMTGSGLSITEWQLFRGALPPLTDAAWQAAFDLYRQIPQYELLNKGMTLGAFKSIYWWEWSHRQLGRLIGVVYIAGLVWFLVRRMLDRPTALKLIAMGLLLGLQGAVGWIMVASGLKPGMVAVAPVKLALHLTLASVFLATLVALHARLGGTEQLSGALRRGASLVFALVLLQIALGGLVAGSKAGLVYDTFPLMDGNLIPPASVLFSVTPWIENFVDNHALVQFNHRLVAYLLLAAALWHLVATWRRDARSPASNRALLVFAVILAQAGLGVTTLLLGVPLWAGLAHQGLAMIVLIAATHHRARIA